MNIHKNSLVEDLEKLRDLNINTFDNQELSSHYQKWIDQVKTEEITDIDLAIWIENQYHYWNTKDRNYGSFLLELLDKNGLSI